MEILKLKGGAPFLPFTMSKQSTVQKNKHEAVIDGGRVDRQIYARGEQSFVRFLFPLNMKPNPDNASSHQFETGRKALRAI